ncbi:putative protein phosphatase 2C T23F11.1 [Diplonema papillatum]|nr:putative protein phosphatase 2C T23F11.1 [Diplonema papillatum]
MKLVCTDFDTAALVNNCLVGLKEEGTVELLGEGKYVSTVALAVADLKQERGVCNIVSIENSSNGAPEQQQLLRVKVTAPQVRSPSQGLQGQAGSEFAAPDAQVVKKAAARSRSFTTLKATPKSTTPVNRNSPTSSSATTPSASPTPAPNSNIFHDEQDTRMAEDADEPMNNLSNRRDSVPSALPPRANTGTTESEPASEADDSISPEELRACMPTKHENTDFHTCFHECLVTKKRPPRRLFPKFMKAFCEAEAVKYYEQHPEECIAINYDMSDVAELAWNYKRERWATMAEVDFFDELIGELYETRGSFMAKPVVDKETAIVENDSLYCVTCSMQGWRSNNEDAYAAELSLPQHPSASLFGVYDGHGGWRVAEFASKHLHNAVDAVLPSSLQDIPAICDSLRKAFLTTDEKVSESIPADHSGAAGTTANVLLITKDHVFCANAGDSRAVLFSGGQSVRLSHDHKPDSPRECARIKNSGSSMRDGRIEGMLAVSRALGDFDFKQTGGQPPELQAVSPSPDTTHRAVSSADRFIIQACDGIWDVLSDDEATNFVTSRLATTSPEDICKQLCDSCLSPTIEEEGLGTDNMTVNLIIFKNKG